MYCREICVENCENIERAVKEGIDRIELCDNLAVGGTTVSYGVMKLALKLAKNTPVFAMIRPRGGDFFYTEREVDAMCDDICMAKDLGVQGIVIGALTKERRVDERVMHRLLKEAGDLSKTFHMAVDEALDWKEVFHFCIRNGIERVLTHGGSMKESIFSNIGRLQDMERFSRSVTVVLGGGVRYDNLEELSSFFQRVEFHGTKILFE